MKKDDEDEPVQLTTTAAGGSGAQRERAVYERYLPLVRRIAMRVVRRLPAEITIDDVIGAGWVGLMDALRRRTEQMDEEQFEAYASHRIRGSILDYLRSLDPMSRKMRGASRRISSAIRAVQNRLGRAPEEEEIADELGIDVESYRTLLVDIANTDYARLELTDLSTIRGNVDAEPDFLAAEKEAVELIADAIERLPERLRLVLGLYYQEECSLREIGEILGVTESRVCQIHSEAIHRLRAYLEEPAPEVPTSVKSLRVVSGGRHS